MNHIQQIMARLDESAATLGFNPAEVEQGSYQWFQMRLVTENGLQWEQFAATNIASIIGRQVIDVSELTTLDAGKVIAMLEMRLSKLRQRQQEQAQ